MIQDVLVWTLFLAATAFLIYHFVGNSKPTPGCGSNCGVCNTLDFKKIENKIEKDHNPTSA